MLIILPFKHGDLHNQPDLSKYLMMLDRSIDSYHLLSKIICAKLVVYTTSTFYTRVTHVVNGRCDVILLDQSSTIPGTSIDITSFSLWNSYKFECLSHASALHDEAIIGDYDIVFDKRFALRLALKLSYNKNKLIYLCAEDDFFSNARSNNPSYSYLTRIFNIDWKSNIPYNAGIIFTPNPTQLATLFFALYRSIAEVYGVRFLRLKRYFVEGFLEQVIIPADHIKRNQFTFFDDREPSCIDAYNRVDIMHLLGGFKNDPGAIARYTSFNII